MDIFHTFAAFSIMLLAASAAAQESPKVEPLLPELVLPSAVAVRPSGNAESYELFVTDGGRILRAASKALDQPQEIVSENEEAAVALGLLNSRTIVVALAGTAGLRAYEIPDDGETLTADQTKFTVRSPETLGSAKAMTVGPTALFIIGTKDDAGQVWRSRVRSSIPGELKPFVQCGVSPTCAAISARGWLVVGTAGNSGASEGSRLTFYHPTDATAAPALTIEPGLLDIMAIAYSPQGNLYAADFAESDPQRAGIYRIDMDYKENTIGGKAVLVAAIEHPTAMAFAPDGTLYIITRDADNAASKLHRITKVE